jgi:hypothetical protein
LEIIWQFNVAEARFDLVADQSQAAHSALEQGWSRVCVRNHFSVIQIPVDVDAHA